MGKIREWKIEKALKAAKNEIVVLGIKLFNSKCIRVLTFERCKIGSSSLAPHVTNSQSHWQGQEAGSQLSLDEFRHQKELSTQSRLFGGDGG